MTRNKRKRKEKKKRLAMASMDRRQAVQTRRAWKCATWQ